MSLFFSGAVTSSPIKERRTRADYSIQSLGLSLLSPDSSYVCYSSDPASGSSCSCRRSPRLLTNGYYVMTEDSFSWDNEGNMSLTASRTNVSYKENPVRVFRRRRRAQRSLARLLSNMTETCQSWLDERVFRGVFSTPATPPEPETSWLDESITQLDSSCSFTYDHTEIIPPPDKEALPSEPLIQEQICTETCHSQEQFTQSLSGLSDVPPPVAFYSDRCCHSTRPEQTGFNTMKSLLLFVFAVFVLTTLYSRCLWSGLTAAATVFIMIMTFMFLTKSGPTGEWRKAKTEDITSRNE